MAGHPVDVELHPVAIRADRALIDCLVRNLVDNAARHNHVGGWVRVRVDSSGRDSTERRSRRSRRESTAPQHQDVDGHGIGLTVVTAAVAAHGDATVTTTRSGSCRRAGGVADRRCVADRSRSAP